MSSSSDRVSSDAASPIVVFKIGGSLLVQADLIQRIESVLGLRPDVRPVLVCGGGALADVIRDWSGRFPLPDAVSHNLAMQTLDLTATLFQNLLPESCCCADKASVRAAWGRGQRPIILPDRWFHAAESLAGLPSDCSELPQSWEVTSDSLAAAVARQWHATELVLCKSTDVPQRLDLTAAAAAGYVDHGFPRFAQGLPSLGWANLRNEIIAIGSWQP